MRNKLMLLGALTCAAGGSVLLAPSTGEARSWLPCSMVVGSGCYEGSQGYCTVDGTSTVEEMQCFQGQWILP